MRRLASVDRPKLYRLSSAINSGKRISKAPSPAQWERAEGSLCRLRPIIEAAGQLASLVKTVEFLGMSKRAVVLAAVLIPVVLVLPAWAQDAPVATAPIPPPVRTEPDKPLVVVPKPYVPPALRDKAAPAKSAEKPAARAKETDRKKGTADKAVKTAARSGKTQKTAEKRIEKNVAASAKTARPQHWVVERRWAPPPPPFGPSWYERYDRGPPMAYGPYGGGMRVPPPGPWAD